MDRSIEFLGYHARTPGERGEEGEESQRGADVFLASKALRAEVKA